jgi:hypothetical protein
MKILEKINMIRGTEDFVAKAKLIHKNRYLYSKTKYLDSITKVTITCKKHGDFSQLPSGHLKGFNCIRCAKEKVRLTTKTFVKKALLCHGNTYDYSLVEYKHSQLPVKIICKNHGVFKQTPNNHLNNQGCSECSRVSKRGSYSIKKKPYTLGRRKIKLQGYEPYVVDYLIEKHKVKPNDIKVGNQIPNFRYSNPDLCETSYYKDRIYFPDLYLPKVNTIIEVKSVYTFLVSFNELILKRKSVIDAGYVFKLIVMDDNKRVLRIPKFWYKSTKLDFLECTGWITS